jgi:hypothetical protein
MTLETHISSLGEGRLGMRTMTCCSTFVIGAVMLIGFSIGSVGAACLEPAEDLDPSFPADPVIDNCWLPMAPGTAFVYMAETEDEIIRKATRGY